MVASSDGIGMRMKKWFYNLYTLVVCLVGRILLKLIIVFTLRVLLGLNAIGMGVLYLLG